MFKVCEMSINVLIWILCNIFSPSFYMEERTQVFNSNFPGKLDPEVTLLATFWTVWYKLQTWENSGWGENDIFSF